MTPCLPDPDWAPFAAGIRRRLTRTLNAKGRRYGYESVLIAPEDSAGATAPDGEPHARARGASDTGCTGAAAGLRRALPAPVAKGRADVLGLRYHNPELAHHLLGSRDHDLELRWLASDISAIEVRLGERWITVPAVMDGLDALRAPLWLSAVREVQASDPTRRKFDQSVVLTALRAIIDRTQASQVTAGILVDQWSDERVSLEEKRLFIGFELGRAREPKARQDGIGRSLLAGDAGEAPDRASPSDDNPRAAPRNRSSKFKLEE